LEAIHYAKVAEMLMEGSIKSILAGKEVKDLLKK
jgi:hypothetical protein